MARDTAKAARAKSIETLTAKALTSVHEGLKARKLTVADIDDTADKGNLTKIRAVLKERGVKIDPTDGPSKNDEALRNLQEWQALARALEASESPAQEDKREFGIDRLMSKQPNADAPNTGKKA